MLSAMPGSKSLPEILPGSKIRLALMDVIPTKYCGDLCWEPSQVSGSEYTVKLPNSKLISTTFPDYNATEGVSIAPNRLTFQNVSAMLKKDVVGKITGGQDLTTIFSGYVDCKDNSFNVQIQVKGGPGFVVPAGSKVDDAMLSMQVKGLYLEMVQPPKLRPPRVKQVVEPPGNVCIPPEKDAQISAWYPKGEDKMHSSLSFNFNRNGTVSGTGFGRDLCKPSFICHFSGTYHGRTIDATMHDNDGEHLLWSLTAEVEPNGTSFIGTLEVPGHGEVSAARFVESTGGISISPCRKIKQCSRISGPRRPLAVVNCVSKT